MSEMHKKTIEEVLHEGIARFFSSDRPQEIIMSGLDRLVCDVTRELFNSQGKLHEMVKGEMVKFLPANLSSFMDLPRYNDLMATAIKDKLSGEGVTGDMLRRMDAAIDEVLHEDTVPEFVSLAQLLDAFIEANQARAEENKWHVPHVLFQEAGGVGGRSRYVHIWFDPEPEHVYRARVGLREAPRNETEMENRLTIQIQNINDRGYEYGKVITALLKGEPIGRNFHMTTKWERLMAALYFGSSKLVVDCRGQDFTYAL